MSETFIKSDKSDNVAIRKGSALRLPPTAEPDENCTAGNALKFRCQIRGANSDDSAPSLYATN
jgi:hypothetical protein